MSPRATGQLTVDWELWTNTTSLKTSCLRYCHSEAKSSSGPCVGVDGMCGKHPPWLSPPAYLGSEDCSPTETGISQTCPFDPAVCHKASQFICMNNHTCGSLVYSKHFKHLGAAVSPLQSRVAPSVSVYLCVCLFFMPSPAAKPIPGAVQGMAHKAFIHTYGIFAKLSEELHLAIILFCITTMNVFIHHSTCFKTYFTYSVNYFFMSLAFIFHES